MNQIISYLEQSLSDSILNKQEKQTLKSMLVSAGADMNDVNQIRNQMFDLANQKINESNYRQILEWVKNANSVLGTKPPEASQAFFSPGESCRQTINRHINEAKSSLRICVFTISDDMITQAILAAHKRGIMIQLLTDNDKLFDRGSDIMELRRAGIVIKVDNTSNHMHHKFLLTDDSSVITGSYNWTRSAAKFNHENIVVSSDAGLVRDFLAEFNKLWACMSDYN